MSITSIRTRRRRGPESTRRATILGVLTLAALVGVLYVATSLYSGIPLRDYGTVYVETPRVGNLIGHDPVRVAGVRVGQVASIQQTAGGKARIELQIEPGTQLLQGTSAAIRANGLLGARYLELLPGRGADPLPDGSTIEVGSTAMTYGVPDALDVLDAQARKGLGTTLRELGGGTLGRGAQLNTGIDRVTDAIVPFRQIAQAVLARDGAAERLVPALDRLVLAADPAGDDLATLLRAGGRALEPFVVQHDDLEAGLRELPSTMVTAGRGLRGGRTLLRSVANLSDAANRTLADAPAALRATHALLTSTATPLRRTTTVLGDVERAVPPTTKALRAARPLLERVRPTFDELNPMVAGVGPYGCDIINFGLVFRSVTGFGGIGKGPNGPPMQFRLQLVPATPAETTGTADASGLKLREGYPAPCKFLGTRYPKLGQPTAGGGSR